MYSLLFLILSQCSSGICINSTSNYVPYNGYNYNNYNFGIDESILYKNINSSIETNGFKRSKIILSPSPRTFNVWLGGTKISNDLREFYTKPLDPSKNYYYIIKALWDDGTYIIKRINFKGGEEVLITFDYGEALRETYRDKEFKTDNYNQNVYILRDKAEEHRDEAILNNKLVIEDTGEINVRETLESNENNNDCINFGVDIEQLNKNNNLVENQAVLKENIKKIEETLTEDQNKIRITIIGKKEDRERAVRDLNTFNEYKDYFLLQEYDPDNWAVERYGFVTSGQPTIYIQTPDGIVLHRQDDYNGIDDWKKIFEKIRIKDPNYDPTKDPDLRKNDLTLNTEKILTFLDNNKNAFLIVGITLIVLSILLKKRAD